MTQDQIDHLRSHNAIFQSEYDHFCGLSLSLNMTRGKPSSEQLDLANALLGLPGENYDNGMDVRNYGGTDGLPEAKALFAEILDVRPDQVIVGGNSSLTMMYDTIQRACQFGVPDGDGPWNETPKKKFLCPTPGYDRHFLITEHLGFGLIEVEMTDSGPNMDQVEWLVANDDSIKGMWCVPKYSNPTGSCYSKETVERLAQMPAAADFRIIWDNAYAEHHFTDELVSIENIAACCQEAGTENRVIQFASTSKMTFPGAGVAAMSASEANLADALRHISVQSIGPDKVNQVRHLQLLGDIEGLRAHMKKHAAIVKPRFDAVQDVLEKELGELDIATWTQPKGGYFLSLTVGDGLAKRVIELAARAGVQLTQAGAPFPYGKDPLDRIIRIAPTFPTIAEVRQATEVLAACVKLAASE